MAKYLALVPAATVFLMLFDLRGWQRYFTKTDRFLSTQTLIWIHLPLLVALPWMIIASLLFAPKYWSVPWLGDISTTLIMVEMGLALFLVMVGFRRSVNVPAFPCVMGFSRVRRDAFEAHLRRSYYEWKTELSRTDLIDTIKATVTPSTLQAMKAAGAKELVLASPWLHKKDRKHELQALLHGVAPGASIRDHQVKMGCVASIIVRSLQVLLRARIKRKWSGPTWLRVCVTVAKRANRKQEPVFSRPVMDGFALTL